VAAEIRSFLTSASWDNKDMNKWGLDTSTAQWSCITELLWVWSWSSQDNHPKIRKVMIHFIYSPFFEKRCSKIWYLYDSKICKKSTTILTYTLYIYVLFISYVCTCIMTTATGWQPICSQIYYYYYYYYYYHHHHHRISHFSALTGKYSPILGCCNQQD